MKLYDTIGHRSYEVRPNDINLTKTRQSFLRTGRYWIALRRGAWHKAPNGLGIISVRFDVWNKICNLPKYLW